MSKVCPPPEALAAAEARVGPSSEASSRNRMRAAKRHQGCLSGGETPQHGFMAERLLAGERVGDQLSPILTKDKQKEGAVASEEESRRRAGWEHSERMRPDRQQSLKDCFRDQANQISH